MWKCFRSVFSVVTPNKTKAKTSRKTTSPQADTAARFQYSDSFCVFRKPRSGGILCFFSWNFVYSVFSVVTPSETTAKTSRKLRSRKKDEMLSRHFRFRQAPGQRCVLTIERFMSLRFCIYSKQDGWLPSQRVSCGGGNGCSLFFGSIVVWGVCQRCLLPQVRCVPCMPEKRERG